MRIFREQCPVLNFDWTEPLAGRPTVAGCALPGTAKIKNGSAFGAACLFPWSFDHLGLTSCQI